MVRPVLELKLRALKPRAPDSAAVVLVRLPFRSPDSFT
jgi:hypothetical protein